MEEEDAIKCLNHIIGTLNGIMNIKPDTIIFPPGLTEKQKQNAIELCKPDKQSDCPNWGKG